MNVFLYFDYNVPQLNCLELLYFNGVACVVVLLVYQWSVSR